MPSSSSGPRPCNFVEQPTPGAAAVATVRAAAGGPQYSVSTAGGNAGGDLQWESTSPSLDSGWVDVVVTVEAGGSVTVEVDGNIVSRTSIPPGHIGDVQVRAAASADGVAAWQGITVRYFEANSSMPRDSETIEDHCNPSAADDTDKTVQSTPKDADNAKVVITAQVQLQYGGTNLPGNTVIAGSIHVNINP